MTTLCRAAAGTLSVNQTVSLLVATTVTYYSFTLPSESDFYNVSITASDLDTGDASWVRRLIGRLEWRRVHIS